jgi:hypothetical protein
MAPPSTSSAPHWKPSRAKLAKLSAASLEFGVTSSGFTFIRIDAYYQEIVKGITIVAAVVAGTDTVPGARADAADIPTGHFSLKGQA